MIQSGKFSDKKILIVDKEEKNKNDRTWCFWETEPGLFEPLVHRRWEKLWFHSEKFSKLLSIEPFQYKLIRGIDFYNYCLELIQKHSNFEIKYGEVKDMLSNLGETSLKVGDEKFFATYIFNSILFERPALKKGENSFLQHFKGWVIEAGSDLFVPGEATLMDLRVGQDEGVVFVYIMPFSASKALIEYTVFSKDLLSSQEYDDRLKKYINEFTGIKSYNILEEEFGIIPMTDQEFMLSEHHIINIGTAGGQTKASSGFTFKFIQEHSAAIIKKLSGNKYPVVRPARKFRYYDSIFLEAMQQKKISGRKIFTHLFKKNKPQLVLRFLGNKSSLAEDLKIISSLPALPFLKAAVKQL